MSPDEERTEPTFQCVQCHNQFTMSEEQTMCPVCGSLRVERVT
ncbi:MAG: hypothetical protein ABEJ58_07065 [Halodesulfurarchaeum sp.]